MNNESSNVEISVNELKLLVNTLSKSVALSLKKRFTWLWLFAGLLIGVSVTLLIIGLAWKKTDKISKTAETLLKNTNVLKSDLKQIHSEVANLTQTINDLNKNNATDYTPPPTSKTDAIGLNEPQHNSHIKKYTVYLHYSDLKNKTLMENFSNFLQKNGFEVSGIQKVNYKNRDIRFFHDQDKNGAFLLKKHLIGFIHSVNHIDENKVKVINLSHKYPGAQKGLLEVWVDF